MGLGRSSVGRQAARALHSDTREGDIKVALVGNPNVGKSTVFNSLTGLRQHTGNWTGKTVMTALGYSEYDGKRYALYDLPGCYSLSALSAEEEVARDFIYFGGAQAFGIVCDASCLERNLYLALQIIEATGGRAVLAVNLIDEAEKKGIRINGELLASRLCLPVVTMAARRGQEARKLLPLIDMARENFSTYEIKYPQPVENYIIDVMALLFGMGVERWQARVLALRALDSPREFVLRLGEHFGIEKKTLDVLFTLSERMIRLFYGESTERVTDRLAGAAQQAAAELADGAVIEDALNSETLPCENDDREKTSQSSILHGTHAAPPKKSPPKESPPKESPPQKSTAEESTPQESVTDKSPSDESPFKENIAKESRSKESQSKDSQSKKSPPPRSSHRNRRNLDRGLDKLLVGRWTAFPIMALLLLIILWITVKGANYPSELLSRLFVWLEATCAKGLSLLGAPQIIVGMLCEGVIRVTGWVVAVMLPPMAIFFPLFTLLEDVGYLPRIAFNLDRCFKGCRTCGKQALTMCMGLGCNASGIVGCRIIESRRERLIAILTNSFMPCNGRFPMLIAMISMFFAAGSGVLQAGLLAAVIAFAVAATLIVSAILAITVFKGTPSSFILELPPYRAPQIGKVIVRSMLDRTLFVLGRAVAVAAPTGLVIWCLANFSVFGETPLAYLSQLLNPIGGFFGLDGVILLAFILGLPANEIVIPIMLLCYTASGGLSGYSSLLELKVLLIQNGWSSVTALNMLIMTVFHSPCSTSLLTVKKETGSIWLTIASAALPTAIGLLLCFAVRALSGV